MSFRKATRENAHLIIILAGGTGSGKTKSALRLATGLAGGKRFALIDTEAGRASHYAAEFDFDVDELSAPFTPTRYGEKMREAESAGYPVIVVDSFSHEHAGEGGLLDMQEEELTRMAGDNWQKREACKMAAWVKPKMEHKKLVQHMLQIQAHLILCLRAEQKIEMVKDGGKWEIRPKQSLTGKDGWIPVVEKNLPFEATCSFLLLATAPGVPNPIKLYGDHRPFFPAETIDEQCGRNLANWAAGVTPKTTPAAPEKSDESAAAAASKRLLVDMTRSVTGCKSGYKLDETQLRALEQYLIDEAIISDTEPLSDMTPATLADAVAKLKSKLA